MAEFSFFNVETKVRDLVSQLLDPVILRAAEDRQMLDKLKKMTDGDRKKLEDLEFAHAKAMRKFGVVDEANRRVQDMAASLGVVEAALSSRIESIAARLDKTRTDNSKHEALYKSFSSKAQFLESEFLRFDELLTHHRDAVLKQYQEAMGGVASGMAEVKQAAARMEDEVEHAKAAVAHVTSILPLHQSRIEVLERLQADHSRTLSEVQTHSVSLSRLQAAELQLTSQINYVARMLSEEAGKRGEIELYLETGLPVLTQFLISNSIMACAEKRQVNKYLAFESSVVEPMRRDMREMRKSTGIESLKKVLLTRANEMEVRRLEHEQSPHSPSPVDESASPRSDKRSRVSFALKVQPADGKPIESSFITAKSIESVDSFSIEQARKSLKIATDEDRSKSYAVLQESLPQELTSRSVVTAGLEGNATENQGNSTSFRELSVASQGNRRSTQQEPSELALYEQTADYLESQERLEEVDDEWIDEKVQELVYRTIPALQSQCSEALKLSKATAETHEQLINTLRNEVEATSKREKRNHIDVKTEFSVVETRLATLDEGQKTVEREFETVNEACRTLAGGLTAIQSLLAQDEVDREQIQLTGYKEQAAKGQKSASKPVLALNTECLSCSGQAQTYLAAFKMACLNYTPSNVKFAGRTLTRVELLELVDGMAKRAEEKTATQRAKPPPPQGRDEGKRRHLPELVLTARGKVDQGTTPRLTRRGNRGSLDLSFV